MSLEHSQAGKLPSELTAQEVATICRRTLLAALADAGVECPTEIVEVLVECSATAQSWQGSLEASERLAARPLRSLREQTLDPLPLDAVEEVLNAALGAFWQRTLQGQPPRKTVADWTRVPYWGKVTEKNLGEVRRGPAQNGTTYFFVYATLRVKWHGQWVTVALTRVRAGESAEAVLKRLWGRAQGWGLAVEGLFLDKGFYSVGVVQFLQEAGVPHGLAVVRRGEKQGTAARLGAAEKEWGFAEERPPVQKQSYTMTPLDKGQKAVTATLVIDWEAVEAAPGERRQRGKKRKGAEGQRWRAVGYLVGGEEWEEHPERVLKAYGCRNSVESSYRQAHETRGRTSTQKAGWRLWLFGVAVFLQNVWVWVRWERIATRGAEGQRQLPPHYQALPFLQFCRWLDAVFVRKYGIVLHLARASL
jgi:putative transposase